MDLALSGFLFEENYNSQSISYLEFCNLAKKYGYDAVELRQTQLNLDTCKEERREILKITRDYDLYISCLTARGLPEGGKEREEFFKQYLELCNDVECNLLKISSDTEWLSQAADNAKQAEIVLASNNHVGGLLETVRGTKNYFAQINHSHMCLLYDPFHLFVTGEDYLECIPELSNITCNILMQSVCKATKDEIGSFMLKNNYWKRALPDEEGVQDWEKIFSRFKANNYNGLITVIENSWPGQQRKQVAKYCANYVKDIWGKN